MAAVGWRTIHRGRTRRKPQLGHQIDRYLLPGRDDIWAGEVVDTAIAQTPVCGGFFYPVA